MTQRATDDLSPTFDVRDMEPDHEWATRAIKNNERLFLEASSDYMLGDNFPEDDVVEVGESVVSALFCANLALVRILRDHPELSGYVKHASSGYNFPGSASGSREMWADVRARENQEERD